LVAGIAPLIYDEDTRNEEEQEMTLLNPDQQMQIALLRGLAEMSVSACQEDWADNGDLSSDEMCAVMLRSTVQDASELSAPALLNMMTILTVMLAEERREQ
jgi:hypothetical protein